MSAPDGVAQAATERFAVYSAPATPFRERAADEPGRVLRVGTCDRATVHARRWWHRSVCVCLISPDGERLLVQRRTAEKDTFPRHWDISAAGHVSAAQEVGPTEPFAIEARLRDTVLASRPSAEAAAESVARSDLQPATGTALQELWEELGLRMEGRLQHALLTYEETAARGGCNCYCDMFIARLDPTEERRLVEEGVDNAEVAGVAFFPVSQVVEALRGGATGEAVELAGVPMVPHGARYADEVARAVGDFAR